MALLADNPGQGNRGGQEYGEEGFHKSGRNQDAQHYGTTPEEEKLKQAHHETLKQEHHDDEDDNDEKDEKFSPGQDDNYDPEKFNTD